MKNVEKNYMFQKNDSCFIFFIDQFISMLFVFNIMYLIAYDIASSERLKKVANVCEKYANRVQKSVFEGELSASEIHALKNELKEIIDEDNDSIIIYTIPMKTIKAKIIMGKTLRDPFILI